MKTLPTRALLLLSLLALVGGCSTVPLDPAGTNVAVTNVGEFSGLVNADLGVALAAAERALREEGMVIIRREARRFEAYLVARDAADRKVRIHIHEVNSRQTQVDIRVGWVRHAEQAQALYERIDRLVESGARARF